MTRRPDPFLAAVRWLETWWLEQRATNRPRTTDPMLDPTYSALAAVLVVAHRHPEFVASDIEWPADLHDDDRAAVMEEAERRRWIARIGEVGRAGRQPVVLWASLVYTPGHRGRAASARPTTTTPPNPAPIGIFSREDFRDAPS